MKHPDFEIMTEPNVIELGPLQGTLFTTHPTTAICDLRSQCSLISMLPSPIDLADIGKSHLQFVRIELEE